MERVAGIEPAHRPWQGCRLPLHHTRASLHKYITKLKTVKYYLQHFESDRISSRDSLTLIPLLFQRV